MASTEKPGEPPTPAATGATVDRTAARYLFAVATLSGDETRVATGDLREFLGVSPASVSEMASKLDERGLLDHEKYAGVALTERGQAAAQRVAWRYCVVERFFDAELGAPLDEQTAFDIGVALPRPAVRRLRDLVSAPCLDRCPESDADRCVA